MKKILIISAIVVVLGIVTLGLYAYLTSRNQAGTGEPVSLRDFLPFGRAPQRDQGAEGGGNGATDPEEGIPGGETPEPAIRKISSFPVAGAIILQSSRAKEIPAPDPEEEVPLTRTREAVTTDEVEEVPAVRYIERATGNIYETFLDRYKEVRLSSTLIPRVHDAIFTQGGNGVVFRYLKSDGRTIESYAAPFQKPAPSQESAPIELRGAYLRENTLDLSAGSAGSRLFGLSRTPSGTALGETMGSTGEKPSTVFTSPITEWLTQWPSSRLITLTTKASSEVPGFMFSLDPQTKSFQKILGDVHGLTTLTSPDGKYVLYSESAANGFRTRIFDTETRTVTEPSVTTLPEKCVWTMDGEALYCGVPSAIPSGDYPDHWYQGRVSFSDSIWKVYPNGVGEIVASSEEIPEHVDATKLYVNKDERYLSFINKTDSFLWVLDLR